MPRLFFVILIFFFSLLPSYSVVALGFFHKKSLAHKITQKINLTNPQAQMGIKIIDIDSSEVVFEQNAGHYFYPASLTKIFTCLGALKKLGPDHMFETTLWKHGRNIYIHFSGDTTFTLSHLQELFRTLKNKKIQGNIYIVHPKNLKLPFLPEGWTIGSTHFCYGAGISPVSINANVVRFQAIEGPRHSVRIEFLPDQVMYPIENKSYRGTCNPDTQIERYHLDLNHRLKVSGCIGPSLLPLKMCLPIPVENLKNYIEKNIRTVFTKEGIKLSGKVLFAEDLPAAAILVQTHTSAPLIEMLEKGMKDSDNIMLNSILLATLENRATPLKKWEEAGKELLALLEEEFHCDLSGARITEGSGLSYYNLISPTQLIQLMGNAVDDAAIKDLFLQTLAIGGKEGTLEQRFKNLPDSVQVIGKTGSLSSVCSLAGFVLKNEKPKFAFVFIFNGISEGHAAYRNLQDEIIQILADE